MDPWETGEKERVSALTELVRALASMPTKQILDGENYRLRYKYHFMLKFSVASRLNANKISAKKLEWLEPLFKCLLYFFPTRSSSDKDIE